ncbi:hypothetical protein LTR49_005096 [Elasticomyces elasticus]|nr:hypothetical protein LTR49_005096 [Elasticomyces elasticus]KAK5765910.1 hypothetical protein LTS12_003917 [Elasticomyces elasticus]
MADETRTIGSGLGLDDDEEMVEALSASRDRSKIVNFSPPHRLGWVSVVCIIINRMIGTGIYRTPATVINGTQSVGVTLLFWCFGACAAFGGTLVYTEFGLRIPRYDWDQTMVSVPRNGGELNYLKHFYKRPEHLATCIFAVVFLLLGNVAFNALFFGEYVLVAAGIDTDSIQASTTYNSTVRGIAITVTTVACLIHGSWRRGGIWLNNIFAMVKVLMLVFIFVVGMCAAGGVWGDRASHALENMAFTRSFEQGPANTYGYSEGFLAVVFAYSGFNQANYMVVVKKEDQIGKDTNVALMFFQNTFANERATRVLAAFMAISSLGNIIVMTFTAARVKQEIAKQGVLPFAKFIGQSSHFFHGIFSRIFKGQRKSGREEAFAATPVGALVVHWLFTIVLILATWTEAPLTAYKLLVSLWSYTIDAFFGFAIGVALLCLRFRMSADWKHTSPINAYISVGAALCYSIAMAFPLVASWIPPSNDPRIQVIIPNYPWFVTPTVGWGLIALGILYWISFKVVLRFLEKKRGKRRVVEIWPCLHERYGYPVQFHEIVSIDWEVYNASGGSSVRGMTGDGRAEEIPLHPIRGDQG